MGQGILAVVASATILGVMPSMQKQLMVDGLPIFSLMFFTNLIITLVTLAVSLGRGRSLKVSRPQLLQVVLMGLTGMVATAMLINTAYLFMPVGTVTMLHFLYPTVARPEQTMSWNQLTGLEGTARFPVAGARTAKRRVPGRET